MDVSTKSFATAGDALYLSQGYLANGGTYTPGAAPLFVNQDNELTFSFSGTHSGWYLQPYGVTQAGQLVPLAVKSDQSGQLVQYASAGINPASNTSNSWVYDFPPGKFADCYLKVVTAGTGTPTAEITSAKVQVNPSIVVAIPTVTAIGVTGGTTTLSGFLAESATTSITAHAGGGQTSAVGLTTEINRLTVVATTGDSAKLPPSQAGLTIAVIHTGAANASIYPSTGDAINGQAANAALTQMPNSVGFFVCTEAGQWWAAETGGGFSGSLPTLLAVSSISAAGTGQSTATQLAAAINNVTTVSSGTGVNLPASAIGLPIVVINNGANPLLVYPLQGSSDTINGVAATVGVVIQPGTVATFTAAVAGAWTVQAASTKSAAFNTNTATSGTTLTAANVTGGVSSVDLALTGTLGAGANAQLPTVAAMVAALHCPTVGTSYRFRIINESSANYTWTVTTNTGWTLTGTMTVAQNTWREFVVTLTSLTAATLQSVATGTYS